MTLNDRVVIVTGADAGGSRLGAAILARLATAKAKVVGN